MKYETDRWRVIKARWFTDVVEPRNVRVIVIHCMEYPEKPDSAEIIARDFANRPADNKASAHICVDNNSIIQCVMDNDIALAAPGANHDGIQIELAGYARQTREEWIDAYGKSMLALAADATAQYCLKYEIVPDRLSDAELRAGRKGIVGHDQVTRVYKRSTHTDPGRNFPWDYFMGLVVGRHMCRRERLES